MGNLDLLELLDLQFYQLLVVYLGKIIQVQKLYLVQLFIKLLYHPHYIIIIMTFSYIILSYFLYPYNSKS
jgi:hypothetical protein